jgi:thiol-disulfide isomerase/thioredoxin
MKILKFGAVWCKDCLVMRPMWEEIEKEMPELKTEYFDADNCETDLKKFKVDTIPQFIFLDKEGNEFLRLKGIQNKEDLIEIINNNKNK